MYYHLRKNVALCLYSISLLLSTASAQKTVITDSSTPGFRTVIPGIEYKKHGIYQFFWGNQYRKEWTTPVKVPVVDLSTEFGGLTPLEEGGGRQTLTLRLKDKNGKQYVLRSVDKKYGKALPKIVEGTFAEDLANDEVSTAHPFGALTVSPMIEATGVYHTNPKIVFVPYSPVLGKYNKDFANTLCLLEERPDDNQQDAANFGFSEDVKGTEKMFDKFYKSGDYRVDQRAFVKARLFDMFLGDWGRHDDQWRWAEFDSVDSKIYKPIPRDRDQVYTRFNGFLVKRALGIEELEHLRTFSSKIKNIKKYNFPARYLDRQLTNEVVRQDWIDIAKQLQATLTDAVISEGVHRLPPEMFAISGNEIIAKLKQRRNDLEGYAAHYYHYLNKKVEVVGTSKAELFSLIQTSDHEVTLQIFDLKKDGNAKTQPFYSRVFDDKETNELRLYGLGGHDIFKVDGLQKGIRVRVIGSFETDSVFNNSSVKIKVYDNPDDHISGHVKSYISSDTSINRYDYKAFKYNSGHIVKLPFYSNTRGIHLLAGYTYTREQWRKQPFGWKQTLRANYSVSNSSFGLDYQGIFNQAIGKWNLLVDGAYDQKLKNYFFGAGNDTRHDQDIAHYQYLTEEGTAAIGLNRIFGKHHTITVRGFYQAVRVLREDGKFIAINLPAADPTVFDRKQFGGGELTYDYLKVNDMVVPTNGFGFSAGARYTQNLKQSDRSFTNYKASFGFYVPISKSFSLAVRSGGATLSGDAEFYQLNWLGGGQNLRGFHRQRFAGKTAFYDDNELRWLPDVRIHLFNGKMGLIAFFDNGRVWQAGQNSDTWHVGYGGGFLVAPFNKLAVALYYGMSNDDKLFHVRLGRFF